MLKRRFSVQQSNVKTAQSAASVADAKIAAAKAKLWKAQTEYDRYKKLFDAESATRQQLETIESVFAGSAGRIPGSKRRSCNGNL